MHELSIADALLELACRHVPAGAQLMKVTVRAGPMRAIDPEAMRFAWHAALAAARMEDAELRLEILPWTLLCSVCRKTHDAVSLESRCPHCRHPGCTPVGGDELQVTSIEVEDPPICSADPDHCTAT